MLSFPYEIHYFLQPMLSRKSKLMENAYTYAKKRDDGFSLTGLTGLVGSARPGELARRQTCAIAKKALNSCVFSIILVFCMPPRDAFGSKNDNFVLFL